MNLVFRHDHHPPLPRSDRHLDRRRVCDCMGVVMEDEYEDEVIWARDLDGTGSMHICCEEDEGARKFIRSDVVQEMVLAALRISGAVGK